jgi:RNA recognition motif-containing protein
MKILIRNLARSTTEESLKAILQEFGTVQSCNIVMDKATSTSKGFGFAEIPKIGEAKAAISNLNGKLIDGNKLRVKKADQKPAESETEDD